MFNSSTMLRTAALAAFVALALPAQAAPVYTGGAILSPDQEVPPVVVSSASGVASVIVDDKGDADDSTFSISWEVAFTGLTRGGPDNLGLRVAHFHGPAPVGTNAPPTIDIHRLADPQGATEGTLTGSADLSAVQLQQILDGLWYINVHSYAFPPGEIRGQVELTAVGGEVPLPGTLGLLALAGLGLAAARRRRA